MLWWDNPFANVQQMIFSFAMREKILENDGGIKENYLIFAAKLKTIRNYGRLSGE